MAQLPLPRERYEMLQGPPTPYYPSPHLLNQFCTFHPAVVKNLKDPEGRGRVKVECPGLGGTGKDNWSCWVEVGGTPIGSNKEKGDEGDWWPLQVGQCVLIGFVAGYPKAMWLLPGPPCSDGAEQHLPAEPKSYNDGRKMTRCRVRKSEAGHTLIMDDNGKSELFAGLSWSGSGWAIHAPGKEKDEDETEDEESKPRKGVRRETKNVFTGTAKAPSELLEGGKEYQAYLDLCKQGLYLYADDKNGGYVCIGARLNPDAPPNPSIVLDATNNMILLTAGKTQLQIMGFADRIFVTKQMIVKSLLIDVGNYFKTVLSAIGKRFSKFDG